MTSEVLVVYYYYFLEQTLLKIYLAICKVNKTLSAIDKAEVYSECVLLATRIMIVVSSKSTEVSTKFSKNHNLVSVNIITVSTYGQGRSVDLTLNHIFKFL